MIKNYQHSKYDVFVAQQNIRRIVCSFLMSLLTFSISQAQTYLRQDFETPFIGTTTFTSAMSPAGSATSIPINQNWSATRTIIRHDGFPDGINSSGDQDWERNVNTGTTTWTLAPTSAGTRPDAAVSGTGVLWFNNINGGSNSGEYMRTLLSPTLDLTTSTSPYARFWIFLAGAPALVPLRIVASKDNGATWKSIMVIPSGFANTSSPISSTPWQQVNVVIPTEFKAANVKIGIEASPDGQPASNIWIDDFTVEEFMPTTITSAVAGDWNTAATWTGGIIPNANNHVVIAHAITTNSLASMTRCQNLTIQATGTLTMGTTTFSQLMHVMGNLTVDVGGNGNFLGSTTTGKLLYIGGNVVNNGNLNFGIPATITSQSRSGLYFCGGAAATYSGTGTVGIPTNRTIPAIMHNNPSGVTYNAPLIVSSQCMLYTGDVNPNGNLTLGQNIANFDFTMYKATGNLTARPIWGALQLSRISNLRYVSTNETLLTKRLIQTGHEVAYNGTDYVVTGSLFVSTFDNIELTFPMSIGSGITAGGFWTMARGIIYSTPTNLLTVVANSNAAMADGANPTLFSSGAVNNHGSYVIGSLRVIFGTGFSVSRQFPMGLGGNFCTPTRNNNALKLVTFTNSANWANQSVIVSLEANRPMGNVNMPLLALASSILYRIQDIGTTPLTPTTSNISFVGVNTDFAPNSNNLQGDGADLRIAQSLISIAGTWTNRSTSGSTAGNITNYTNYTVNTAASSHLPLATNGEYFTFASISPPCTGVPAFTNTVSSATTVSFGGSVKLSLQNATAGTGLSYQWHISVDNGMTFTNIVGEIAPTYIATNITRSTQYRCRVTCIPSNLTAFSNPITVNLLAAPTATNGSACGSAMSPVAVSLQATATTGTLNWYQTATSNTVLGTGTPFLTPPIGAATDFFVNEQRNSTTIGTGLVDNVIAAAFAPSPAKGQALVFTTLSSGTLNSVAVYPAAAGTATIQLYNSTGLTALGASVVATFTAAQVGVKTLVPLNTNIPFAGTYRLVNENIGADIALGQISLLSPLTQYPFINTDGLLSVIASAITPSGGFNTNIYNSFFDINFTGLALSARTKVTASLVCSPPPPPPNPSLNQTITFDSLQTVVFSNQLYQLTATASSTLPVSYTISGNATVLGLNFLQLTGLGDVIITANQSGGFVNNTRYLAAVPVTRRLRVIAASQTLTGFETIADRPWNSSDFLISATTNSNLPVTFTITEGANIAEITNGNIVRLKPAIGKVTITATQAGNGTTNAATPIVRSFNVIKADQNINSVSNVPTLTYRVGLTQTLSASATSGLAVTASVVSGNATITNNNVLSFTSAGTVVIRYTQAGNDLWNPATSVDRTIVVEKANQNITLTSSPTSMLIGTSQTVVASASSGLPVTMRVVSGTATINGLILTPTDGSSVEVELNQAGDANYNAATPVRFTISIIPTLTLTSVSGTKFCGGAIITVNFVITGAFAPNNRIAAYLSDANGVFTNDRRYIGSIDSKVSGSITGIIPENIPSGKGYKVRMESIFPAVFSAVSTQTLELNAVPEMAIISQDGAALVSSIASGVQWFANGLAISGATSQRYTPTAAQSAANTLYSVVITNASGCTSVSGFANYQPPVVTGIDNPALSAKLSVYPNPTENKITVELGLENVGTKAAKVGIKLTDATGRIVFNENVSANGLNFKHDIDMKDLASGVYMLLLNVEGKTAVKRIVKQ